VAKGYETGIRSHLFVFLVVFVSLGALVSGCGTRTATVTVTTVSTVVERVAPPAGAVLMPRRDGELVYRPSVVALSDSFTLTGVHWRSFGKRLAVGRGTYYLNACEPTCPLGHRDKVTGEIDLTRPKPCRGHLAYEIITIEGPGMKVRDEPISRVINATRPTC
jgi:hypothetical protein